MSPHKVTNFTTNGNNKQFLTDILELFNWTKEMFINTYQNLHVLNILEGKLIRVYVVKNTNFLLVYIHNGDGRLQRNDRQ